MAQLPTRTKIETRLGPGGSRVKQIQKLYFLFGWKEGGLKRIPRQFAQMLVGEAEL